MLYNNHIITKQPEHTMYKVIVTNNGIITEYCLTHSKALQIKDIWARCHDVTVVIEAIK
jgi:hypothetical protein